MEHDWIGRVWFSDESNFFLSGKVNKTYCVFWGSKKPDKVLQRPLHSEKVTMWAVMSSQGIIGPFFFQDENEKCQSVTSERYIDVLNQFKESLRRKTRNPQSQWIMQDGAPLHTADFPISNHIHRVDADKDFCRIHRQL